MRTGRVLWLILLVTSMAAGQIVDPSRAHDPSPSQRSLAALLGRISGLPVEYKADLAFTIIDAHPSSISVAQERILLNDVFHSAASAHYPYMIVDAAPHPGADALQHVTRNMLIMLKLDALDIQMRAIDHALPLSPQFANHLFQELRLGEVRASCKDATVEDLSSFYTTATKIVEDKRIKTIFKQDKALYLQSLASNIRLPSQIAPFATLLAQVSLSREQLAQVESAFESSLSRITASDREMTAVEEAGGLTHAIELLFAKLTQSDVSSARLLVAYRGFLLRGLTRERCADYSLDRERMARRFETLVRKTPESSRVNLLSGKELTPESIGDAASYAIIPLDKQLITKMQRIMAARRARSAEEYRLGRPGTIEPDPSDVDEVLKYAVSLESSGSACPVCDFQSKGALFLVLVDNLPAGHQLERVISHEVDYLSSNRMQKDDPVAWLLFFKSLVNDSRKPDDKASAVLIAEAKKGRALWALPSPEADVIRDSLRRSADPIMAVYMFADDLLHLPYEPLIPKDAH